MATRMAPLRYSRITLFAIRRQPRTSQLFRDLHTTRALSNRAEGSRAQSPTGSEALHSAGTNELPGSGSLAVQPTDLLTLYRGLVARGEIEYDEDQVRAVMRLRRLTRELEDYVPNLVSGHAVPVVSSPGTSWWTPQRLKEEGSLSPDSRALLARQDMARELAELSFPKGVILIAPPGRGKTFLLDMWFSSLPTKHKARKHYSTLTLELYRAVWEETQHRTARHRSGSGFTPASVAGRSKWSTEIRRRWRALFAKGDLSLTETPPSNSNTDSTQDSYASELPMAQVLAARLLLRQGWLLHIDELQLLDIGSATILSDVLGHFWRMGGVVVATSNKVPGELYKNGLGAERVKGFVSALEARCDVVVVGGEQDWRRMDDVEEGEGEGKSWYLFEDKAQFEDAVSKVVSGKQATSMTLNIFSRRLHIPHVYLPTSPPTISASGPVARFAFDDICNAALGTADYTTIASTFSTLILTDVPILRLSTKDRARRFIMLVDALYEARVKLICHAEAPIDGLFFPDELGAAEAEDNARTMMEEALSEGEVSYRPNVSVYGQEKVHAKKRAPPPPSPKLVLRELSIFTGQEEKFAYARATSRLVQMTSAKYAAQAIWQPLARAQQPWHRDVPPSPDQPTSPTATVTPNFATDTSSPMEDVPPVDWAEEASYDARRGRSGRPEPPRLSENHAWGVRDDWGKGAGEWGKGVKGKN